MSLLVELSYYKHRMMSIILIIGNSMQVNDLATFGIGHSLGSVVHLLIGKNSTIDL
jgi:hypothetical protein